MMNVTMCPDKETLFGYLSGTIPETDADSVTAHVAGCAECEQILQGLEGRSDPVVSLLRQPAPHEPYPQEPECRNVLERLRSLEIDRAEAKREELASSEPKKVRRVSRLGDYDLVKKLGQGGMGTVYQARHTKLKRLVALKVLPKDRLSNADAIARFEREMEAVGRLDHPNIVRAMDAREINGIRFLVMEYVDGLDLSEVVRRCGPFSVADVCEAIRLAAIGLGCAHENGLVHRDIKPSNLMLAATGEVKVLDLGLAQIQEAETLGGEITGVGQVMGTPDYLPPEQALASRAVDARTDLYSLGCTLYHLLAGKAPFSGPGYETAMQKVSGHLRDPAPAIALARSDVPRPVASLLERMLAKAPDGRPASASEVASLLAPFCQGSKLIGLLREARRTAASQKVQDAVSRIGTEAVQMSAVETSREEIGRPEQLQELQAPTDLDPYHRWLGIPPSEQPPNHYRLLGLALFETDPEVIRDAAARQMAHVRTYHLGQHAELSQRILNELAAAKTCLLTPEKKVAYDAELRRSLSPPAVEPPPPPESPVQGQKVSVRTEQEGVENGSSAVAHLRRPIAWPGSKVAKLRRPATRGKSWLWSPAGITTMVAAFLTVLFLGAVIAVQTNYGTVKIEIAEGISDVEVKLDGDTISIEGLDRPLRIRPGEHDLSVASEGFETYCRSFTVKRGGNPALAVTLIPLAAKTAVAASEPSSPAPAERELPPQDRDGGGGADRMPNGSPRDVVEATGDNWESRVEAIPESPQVDKTGVADAHPISSSPVRENDRPEPRLPTNMLTPEQRADGWELLFDGTSLDGWKLAAGDAQFRVDDGAIVAATHTGMKKTFLCREESVENFLLDLEVQIDEGMNSGVQIRSQRNGNEISGYQVEIDSSGKSLTGAIFDEGRRNRFLGEARDGEAARKAMRLGEWNSLRVSAVGDDIKTWLNGTQIADVTDSASRSGFIGLQLLSMDSGGPPKQIRFRNIRFKSLPSTPPPAASATKEKPEAPRMPNTLTYAERAEGWRLLFDGKSLSGWQGPAKHYAALDGKLVSDFGPKVFGQHEGGELFTRRQYDDFVLRFEFRLERGANSGVVVRASGKGLASRTGMEIQILDDSYPDFAKMAATRPWMMTGAIAGVVSPQRGHQRPAGEWNSMEITCQNRHLRVMLNGVVILDADLDSAARRTADGEDHPGLRSDRGYIGLHGYGSRGRVEYRNLQIKDSNSTNAPQRDAQARVPRIGQATGTAGLITLRPPYRASYPGASTDRLSLQNAVTQICSQIGLEYQSERSQKEAGSEVCRRWTYPHFENIPAKSALEQLLKPHGIGYAIDENELYLRSER